ncbi:MAG: rod-binding protein [Candidatus Sericytochromatia bacterium]|nr:rod-binding protein [Candidatus Sericytochromatia bacterium]
MKVENTAAAALNGRKPAQPDAGLQTAVQDFEALFVGQVMKAMRQTVPEGGLFGHQPQEQMMRDLLDEEWGREIASGRGMGLAQVLYRQLQSTQ